jgi:hypothetical protein
MNHKCLKHITLYNNSLSGATILTKNQSYTTFIDHEGSYKYTMNVTSEPLCLGYETKNTTYEAILIARDGVTSYNFITDLTVYQTCREAAVSTCLGHD